FGNHGLPQNPRNAHPQRGLGQRSHFNCFTPMKLLEARTATIPNANNPNPHSARSHRKLHSKSELATKRRTISRTVCNLDASANILAMMIDRQQHLG
ncbi:MAG TPA: hypothetical protein VKB48_16245, partial [Candidatus Acidoferrum sp.]|nr:hypothetical protein [Candidatus Acidoferrum sp.]